MTTIVTRSGKGAPLTYVEMDANFTNLNSTKLEASALSPYETTAHAASTYAPLASPTFTGNPVAPTPAVDDNDTSIATSAYVFAERSNTFSLTNKTVNLASNTVTGTTAQFNTALSDGDFTTLAGSETLTNKTMAATTNNVEARSGPNSSAFTLRNKVINGDMRMDQRNSGGAVTPTVTAYVLDRFEAVITQASKLTFQQIADAPAGFKFSQKITVNAQFSPGAADRFIYTQPIEGQSIVDLQLGTATATQITVSLWVKGSIAGTYSISLFNGAGTRSYVGTITVAAGWVKQTVTLTGDTTGTWATDSTSGLFLSVDLGSGSNFNTTAGAWQAGLFHRTAGSISFVNQVNGSTLNIAGVQVEQGAIATPFETRPIGIEDALCKRYYTAETVNAKGMKTVAGDVSQLAVQFKQTMRATPTIVAVTTTNGIGTQTVSANANGFSVSAGGSVGDRAGLDSYTATAEL